MFKTLAFVSVLTSAAFAQSSSSSAAAATSTANPLIPTGISSTCTSFLTSLNSDASVKACFAALTTATSPFAPGSTTTPTSATVTNALTGLCADSVASACSESLIRSKITDFYTACPAELTTNKVASIITMYDALYALSPMRTSVCSKDDSGNWCAMSSGVSSRELSDSVSGGSSMDLAKLLSLLYTDNGAALKRRAAVSAIVPNMTTYHDTNLPFLFFNPDQDATALCTSCSRQVLTSYMNFESNVPYAPGLSSSSLLDTQSALYSAIASKCPTGFLTGAVQAAGGLSAGILGSGALSVAASEYKSIMALAMGAVTLAISFAL